VRKNNSVFLQRKAVSEELLPDGAWHVDLDLPKHGGPCMRMQPVGFVLPCLIKA
jgi:hypothetical protein